MGKRRTRRRRDQRGVVAIVVSFSMIALLIVAGIVIDLGQARTDKLTNRTYTDDAAAAGIRAADVGDGTIKPFQGACAALANLEVSDPDLANPASTWKLGNGLPLGGDPCAAGADQLTTTCVPDNPATWAWYTGTEKGVTVEIKSGYLTPDPAFDAPGSGDNSADGGCDQLAVIISQSEDPTLGKAATEDDIVTRARTVARMVQTSAAVGWAPALLLLERDGCSVLSATGNAQLDVYGTGSTAGTIQADSLGDSCNYSGKIYFASGSAKVTAHMAESGGAAGVISTTALSGAPGAVPANASVGPPKICAEMTGPPCADATGHDVVGRGPVDQRYLNGVRDAEALAAVQYDKTSDFGTTAAGVPYTVVGCSPADNAAPAIFVDCPSGFSLGNNDSASFPNATDVVVNGNLTISGHAVLSMPDVARLYVKGSYGDGLALSGGGSLAVNLGGSSTCAGRAGGTTAQVVVGSGAFHNSGNGTVRLCNSTLLLADGSSNTCPDPTSDAGTGQPPADNPCKGSLVLSGDGTEDWTAPNQYSGKPPTWDGLEDLALWTETSAGNTIGGNGNLSISGVFFLPNANPFTISGSGSQSTGADAQFIARRLAMSGSASLSLKPDAYDVVTVNAPSSYQLVR